MILRTAAMEAIFVGAGTVRKRCDLACGSD